MRARTILDLISLSANFYMLSKNEELMKTLHELAEKGKDKWASLSEEFSGEDEETKFIQSLLNKAMQAKVEVENKMEQVAVSVYEKMRIAHSHDLKSLEEKVENLTKELQLTEAKLINLQAQKQ